MNDWIGLISSLKDGSFDKDKYEQISKIGNNNSLAQPHTNTTSQQQN